MDSKTTLHQCSMCRRSEWVQLTNIHIEDGKAAEFAYNGRAKCANCGDVVQIDEAGNIIQHVEV